MSENSAIEFSIIAGIAVPLTVLAINQFLAQKREKARQEREEKSIVNAVYGDLLALKGYIEKHIRRTKSKILNRKDVPIRELKFLRLRSGLDESNLIHQVGRLDPDVAHKIMNFYSHLTQNNIILEIVVSEWERRTKRQSQYQLDNLKFLNDRADKTIKAIKKAYQFLERDTVNGVSAPDPDDEQTKEG